jgi:hypothetical protein
MFTFFGVYIIYKFLITLFLFLCISKSNASEMHVDFSIIKINHSGNQFFLNKQAEKTSYNPKTIMISYNYKNIKASYFKNSHSNNTYYLGYANEIEIIDRLNLGYSIGLSYGYQLKKVFKKDNFFRKTFYKNMDDWEKPILPIGFLYIDYHLKSRVSVGSLLIGKRGYGFYINYRI